MEYRPSDSRNRISSKETFSSFSRTLTNRQSGNTRSVCSKLFCERVGAVANPFTANSMARWSCKVSNAIAGFGFPVVSGSFAIARTDILQSKESRVGPPPQCQKVGFGRKAAWLPILLFAALPVQPQCFVWCVLRPVYFSGQRCKCCL